MDGKKQRKRDLLAAREEEEEASARAKSRGIEGKVKRKQELREEESQQEDFFSVCGSGDETQTSERDSRKPSSSRLSPAGKKRGFLLFLLFCSTLHSWRKIKREKGFLTSYFDSVSRFFERTTHNLSVTSVNPFRKSIPSSPVHTILQDSEIWESLAVGFQGYYHVTDQSLRQRGIKSCTRWRQDRRCISSVGKDDARGPTESKGMREQRGQETDTRTAEQDAGSFHEEGGREKIINPEQT